MSYPWITCTQKRETWLVDFFSISLLSLQTYMGLLEPLFYYQHSYDIFLFDTWDPFAVQKIIFFFQFIAISELYRSIGIYVTSWRPLRHLLFDTLDLKNFLFLSECSNLIHLWRLCSLSVSTKGALLWVNICGSIIDSKGLYPQITLKLKDKISGQVEMIHLIISQNFFLLVQGQE